MLQLAEGRTAYKVTAVWHYDYWCHNSSMLIDSNLKK